MILYREKLATIHDFRLIRDLRTLFSMVFRTIEIRAPYTQSPSPPSLTNFQFLDLNHFLLNQVREELNHPAIFLQILSTLFRQRREMARITLFISR